MKSADMTIVLIGRLLAMYDHAESTDYKRAIWDALEETLTVYSDFKDNAGTDSMDLEIQAALHNFKMQSWGVIHD